MIYNSVKKKLYGNVANPHRGPKFRSQARNVKYLTIDDHSFVGAILIGDAKN